MEPTDEAQQTAVVLAAVLEQAVRNGWPAALFTDVIGQIGDDFMRIPQASHEARQSL
jgi:hypothetical protein